MKIVRNGGFTLIELMIGLVIVAVLLAVAAPAFTNLIKDNRLLSRVYTMRATLNAARTEALAERTFVTVCPSNNGNSCSGSWNEGHIAFTDNNGNGSVDDPNDAGGDLVIASDTSGEATLNIEYTKGAGDGHDPLDRLRFNGQGYATGFDGITPYELGESVLTICDDRGDDKARGLLVSPVGSVRAAVVDPNDPGSDDLADCP